MGLSTHNKKTAKKKLKKKLKKLQDEAQREINQKVDEARKKQEAERQQQLLLQAEQDLQISKLKKEQINKEREAIFTKKRLAMIGIEKEESKSALHRKSDD